VQVRECGSFRIKFQVLAVLETATEEDHRQLRVSWLTHAEVAAVKHHRAVEQGFAFLLLPLSAVTKSPQVQSASSMSSIDRSSRDCGRDAKGCASRSSRGIGVHRAGSH